MDERGNPEIGRRGQKVDNQKTFFGGVCLFIFLLPVVYFLRLAVFDLQLDYGVTSPVYHDEGYTTDSVSPLSRCTKTHKNL